MLEKMWSKENFSIASGSANLYSHFGNQHDDFSENWEPVTEEWMKKIWNIYTTEYMQWLKKLHANGWNQKKNHTE